MQMGIKKMEEKNQNNELISEIRGEFQIPPYFSDAALSNYINEGKQRFLSLVNDTDFDTDIVARTLLKNYVHYAYYKRINEFMKDYSEEILSWQFSRLETDAAS